MAWPPKCHRRRWFEFCSKPGLRGRKPARWWPTRLPTYSPDPQDVKKCWVGQVLSTFGGSAGQKLKFCKPTPTGKKSWKIRKISKNRFFLKGQKWLLEVPTDPQSCCWHPLGPPEAICWLFQKKTIFDIGWKIRFFLWKFYFGRSLSMALCGMIEPVSWCQGSWRGPVNYWVLFMFAFFNVFFCWTFFFATNLTCKFVFLLFSLVFSFALIFSGLARSQAIYQNIWWHRARLRFSCRMSLHTLFSPTLFFVTWACEKHRWFWKKKDNKFFPFFIFFYILIIYLILFLSH